MLLQRIVVFVSGGGSNFKAIHKAILEGQIHGDIVGVISDKTSCGGIDYAKVRFSPRSLRVPPESAPCPATHTRPSPPPDATLSPEPAR